jgi:cysteine desulfuration protein SufE
MSDELQLPPHLNEIVEDFKLAEGREKLEMLLDYSNRMPPLPERFKGHNDMESIPECMTPVFVHADKTDGKMVYYFDVPEESPSVRGYAAIISEGVSGATPEEVLAIPGDFYLDMGLQGVLSSQRMNGLRAILAHIKRLAKRALES